ncbi:fibroleukin-like [Mytilus edulis]|uniref:fibroleukin-like n=1 Tax=Mytilus edulis TaxID=6550 RepID=UPI0039EE5944
MTIKQLYQECLADRKSNAQCNEQMRAISQQLQQSKDRIDHKANVIPNRDCSDLPSGSKSGVYTIHPAAGNNISVFCDMETDNGGWTVIQRRFNGTTDFFRYWDYYKNGFGEISGEHWLGNDNIYLILKHKAYKVRFDFEAFTGETAYAIYDTFNVLDETTNYTLHISDYSGTAGDSMKDVDGTRTNGLMFSTRDRDNDMASNQRCGIYKRSGWWHAHCTWANINGIYNTDADRSVHWKSWLGMKGLRKTKMMIKQKTLSGKMH